MDGMVKNPNTRKEQAYVIALGGEQPVTPAAAGAPAWHTCTGEAPASPSSPSSCGQADTSSSLRLYSTAQTTAQHSCPCTWLRTAAPFPAWLAAAGKDYRDSVLKDAKTSLIVIAGGDPDLRQAVTDGEVKQVCLCVLTR